MAGPTYHVAQPPPKPLLVFDGDCGFCKLWIARWREITAEAVDYEELQTAATRFPEVPRGEFERAVKLIEPDGEVYSSAEAVYRSLGKGRGKGFWNWCYQHLPGFAPISETAYAFIAGHRELAHRVTSIFWGEDVRRPTYFHARRWFLRLLGAIYLIAFLSFWIQADGLIGERGISPLPQLLEAARGQLGGQAYLTLPTLAWLNPSNTFLHFLCAAGAVFSVLLVFEIVPVICLLLLFALYLSLTVAGQAFYSFQWDVLLLETGFLGIFLAPWRWWPKRGRPAPLARGAIFLLQFLLFKLMFLSGVVKLSSGDPSWGNLTALDYHYWTQPLPTVVGWWMDQSPEWLKHFSTGFVLLVELVMPFCIWLPRRFRLLAAGLFILFQVLIGLTGNYAFFNLLTITLCLLLIDDHSWPAKARLTNREPCGRGWPAWVIGIVIALTVPINLVLLWSGFQPDARWPMLIDRVYTAVSPFRLINSYGLFRVMTKERREIILEGSDDAVEWKPYEFKWKPGALGRMPAFVEPYQPRLDWQMWFAALSDARQNPWFLGLAYRLLQNSPDALQLLGRNPFPGHPPRYLRAEIYSYRFATVAEHRAGGDWWQRSDEQTYLPPVSLSGD